MTAKNYPNCQKITLHWETGPGRAHANSDNAGDRRTRDGVTQPVFTRWLRAHGKPDRDVFTMTDEERDAIYRSNYWDLINGDALPVGVDCVAYDCVVNGSHVMQWLRETAHLNPVARIKSLDASRRGYWRHCPTFFANRLGWFRRENDILAHALAMANA